MAEKCLEKTMEETALCVIKKIQDKCKNGTYIFRGEDQFHGKISSGLYRMLEQKFLENSQSLKKNMPENILNYEKGIIKGASKYVGQKLSDIEILSKLQHYGGKTNLIDFTKNLYVALFFACIRNDGKDGRVIILPIEHDKVTTDNNLSTDDIGYPNDSYILVKPLYTDHRMVFQSSIFVQPHSGYLDKDLVEENSISIDGSNKGKIREYLEKYHDITHDRIYNDIHGYIQDQENIINKPFISGMDAYKEGDYATATTKFRESIKANPQLASSYVYLGQIYHLAENYSEAIMAFSNAIEIDPQYPDAYFGRGIVYNKIGETEKATEDFIKAVKLGPEAAKNLTNMGIMYLLAKENDKAIDAFSNAIDTDPQYTQAYTFRNIAYNNIGETEKANADFMKVVKPSPHAVKNFIYIGIIYFTAKNYFDAIMAFSNAIEIDPQNVAAHAFRAQAHSKQAKNKQNEEGCKLAGADIKKAIEFCSKNNIIGLYALSSLIQQIKKDCPNLLNS